MSPLSTLLSDSAAPTRSSRYHSRACRKALAMSVTGVVVTHRCFAHRCLLEMLLQHNIKPKRGFIFEARTKNRHENTIEGIILLVIVIVLQTRACRHGRMRARATNGSGGSFTSLLSLKPLKPSSNAKCEVCLCYSTFFGSMHTSGPCANHQYLCSQSVPVQKSGLCAHIRYLCTHLVPAHTTDLFAENWSFCST